MSLDGRGAEGGQMMRGVGAGEDLRVSDHRQSRMIQTKPARNLTVRHQENPPNLGTQRKRMKKVSECSKSANVLRQRISYVRKYLTSVNVLRQQMSCFVNVISPVARRRISFCARCLLSANIFCQQCRYVSKYPILTISDSAASTTMPERYYPRRVLLQGS